MRLGALSKFDGYGFVIERVWVETYVPPRPYMERELWVQLDAAWKKAENYTKISQYVSVTSTINATELQEGAIQNATINADEGYITGIDTDFIESYMSNNVQVETLQNITEEFFIPEEIIPGEVYLPLSMQFGFNKSYEYSILPDPLKYKVTLSVDTEGNNLLQYENNLSQIAGLPFVLDFAPSTQEDADKLENGSYPAYEINMTPMIYFGNVSTNGSRVILGTDLNVTLTLELVDTINTTKKSYAVEKTAIVIDAPKTEFLAYNKTFERIRAFQDAGDNETLAREGLYLIGSNFFMSSDFYTDALADSFGLRWSRVKPAVVFVTKENKVDSFEGIPISVSDGGTSIDLKFDQIVGSRSVDEIIVFNLKRGLTISGYESRVLERFYDIKGISTVSIFNKGIIEGVPIYLITGETLGRLEALLISRKDKEEIQNLLLQSPDYFAIVPAKNIQMGIWTGTGYAIIDMGTGAGKYLISGGLAGGSSDEITDYVIKVFKVYCTIEDIADVAFVSLVSVLFLACLYTALIPPLGEISCGLYALAIAEVTVVWVIKTLFTEVICTYIELNY